MPIYVYHPVPPFPIPNQSLNVLLMQTPNPTPSHLRVARGCSLRGDVAVLGGGGLGGQAVVLVDIGGLPRVADPDVADGAGGHVAASGDDVAGEGALLGLVLVLCVYVRLGPETRETGTGGQEGAGGKRT